MKEFTDYYEKLAWKRVAVVEPDHLPGTELIDAKDAE